MKAVCAEYISEILLGSAIRCVFVEKWVEIQVRNIFGLFGIVCRNPVVHETFFKSFLGEGLIVEDVDQNNLNFWEVSFQPLNQAFGQ